MATTTGLRLADARLITDAVVAGALARGIAVSTVVVDTAGHELLGLRMDDVSWFTVGVARSKAGTAAAFSSDTAGLERLDRDYPELVPLVGDQLAFRATTLPGGLVVAVDGVPVGAVGVSGASPDQDVACGREGITAWLSMLS